jgi:hypothetical protein
VSLVLSLVLTLVLLPGNSQQPEQQLLHWAK